MRDKVEVKKENSLSTEFKKLDLSIVEQEQLNCLVSKFLSSDFQTRNKIIK
jgi:hypothetical protein